jgi:hypothetical protein
MDELPLHDNIIHGLEFKKSVTEIINIDKRIFDAFPLLIENLKRGVRTSVHWSNAVTGSDLYEKNRVLNLPNYLSLEVTEYNMPIDLNQHFLAKWLVDTKEMKTIIQNEIRLGNAVLSNLST